MADYYVDPSILTDTGAGTVGDPWGCAIGTANGNHIQRAMDLITAATIGDNIHVKSTGTVSFGGTNLDFTSYGATSQDKNLLISGYEAEKQDGRLATIDLGGASTFVASAVNGTSLHFLDVSGGTGAYQIHANDWCHIYRCKVDGGGVSGGIRTDHYGQIEGCQIVNVSGAACISTFNSVMNNIVTQDSSFISIQISSSSGGRGVIIGNIVLVNTTAAVAAISVAYDGHIIANNTIYSSVASTGYGVGLTGTTQESTIVVNNYVEGFSGTGGKGFYFRALNAVNRFEGNRWFNSSTGADESARILLSTNNSATTASGLTNAGSADYTPTSELIGAGSPSGFLNLSGNETSIDIGAIQAVFPSSPSFKRKGIR